MTSIGCEPLISQEGELTTATITATLVANEISGLVSNKAAPKVTAHAFDKDNRGFRSLVNRKVISLVRMNSYRVTACY